jgi:hypothetical protein
MSIPMTNELGVEQSGKAGGDAHGTGMSGSSAFGGGMGGGGYGFGSGQGGDATSSSTATGALGGDVSDNTSIGSITSKS